ncbi:MAG: hypothetical protein JXB47_06340, partial [Anaerolineae bacterium]|nr:hypothetical protein [Anaerolineae bacterium]
VPTEGIDQYLAQAIDAAAHTVDIAAFEFNIPSVTEALLRAHARGVRVRVVTDNQYGIADEDSTLGRLASADIPIVDDGRSALMHNKFVIIDGAQVWAGSWNFTRNGTFRNNNNVLAIDSTALADIYTHEFEEMFVYGLFGAGQTFFEDEHNQLVVVDGVAIQALFAPEDTPTYAIAHELYSARRSIRFMAFSFTHPALGGALLAQARNGVKVEGIFETRGSDTEYSELGPLYCYGLSVLQDGNPRTFHHKVFIIDDATVVTGSFNFSASADEKNDENALIIRSAEVAAAYNAEFDRRWVEGAAPERISCEWITGTDWDCGGDFYGCEDFEKRCEFLCAYQTACPGDPSKLDRNGDGYACETTCPPCP